MRYLISYDLRSPGQDYDTLIDAIKELGGKKVLQSQWIVRHNNTSAKELRDYLWQFMDSNDRLLVVAIDSTNWAGQNLITKISTF